MNANDFITVDHLLSSITAMTNDRDYSSGLQKGWYLSRIQEAMEELSIDTFWDEKTLDLPLPSDTLTVEIPENFFNVKSVYVYSGDCCDGSTSKIVHHKVNFNNRGYNQNSMSNKNDDEDSFRDPFYEPNYNVDTYLPSNLHYYNIQDGKMMFSSNCDSYDKVRINYNGMGGEIGDKPIIPRFFRQAVEYYVATKYFEIKKVEDRQLRTIWGDYRNELEMHWQKATIRISRMDSWEREALKKYWNKMYY